MNKKTFDNIIKENEVTKIGNNDFGYTASGNSKVYDAYYSNYIFNEFLEEMKSSYEEAFYDFSAGKGSELIEHIGRYGVMPPKMASVASSSRFCYLALRDGADALGCTGDIEFEHECKIKGILGIAPQLDAYIKKDELFIEVKCHEIFDHHRIVMKSKYRELIYGDKNQFGFEYLSDTNDEIFNVPLSLFGIDKTYSMFDIKQFLCHLLGIASHPGTSKKLAYMFFKPKSDNYNIQNGIDNIFSELSHEIHSIFGSKPIRNFCNVNNIGLLAVFEVSKTMEALTRENMSTIYKDF